MWTEDRTSLAASGAGRTGGGEPWRIIGPDSGQLARQLNALSHFGIVTRLHSGSAVPQPDIAVLADLRSGVLVQQLVAQGMTRPAPIVIFGVASAEARARLLIAGADDAVSPRITPCELAARLTAAACRRAQMHGVIHIAGLRFDTGLRHVFYQGHALPVMPREFDMLLVLARHAGEAISRAALLQRVWQSSFDPGTNSVEVHICKLRRHLAALGPAVRIDTVKGVGYRLVTPFIQSINWQG